MKKRLKQIKSTLLGLLLISVSIVLLVKNISHDLYINGGLMISGTLLMFSSDKFIEALEKITFGKILFKPKDDNNLNENSNK